METKNFKRVLVWELPVRFFHWINVLSLIVLTISGFLIANPPALMANVEATAINRFGTVRMIHFIAGYVFFFNMIMRVYWLFVGNRFSNWRAFWPFRKKTRKGFWRVIKLDVLLLNEKEGEKEPRKIGHNSVAIFTYIAMFFVALVSIATGFALYADMSSWWLPDMFEWVTPLLGDDYTVRWVHHVAMWLFIFFSMVHVYLVFYHDYVEGHGEVSSMFGGYKFVNEKRIKHNQELEQEKKEKSA
ncbi:MAG: Ni/Fe-hydrogenase, b-type cytochrome subunit [Flavobacteriaceae bacterium]|nr:Ni/Fe-hydrogenase, b-type cytochrome subunit [Flavobacteriaceae bacterium]